MKTVADFRRTVKEPRVVACMGPLRQPLATQTAETFW
jgi:anthranilate phosphoribosyltransferase